MKKGLNILFIFMLVFQSMFTSMAFSNTAAAEGSKKELDTDVTFIDENGDEVDLDEHEGKLSVQVDWSIDNDSLEAGDKADVHLSISEKIELMSDQSGKLEFENKEIATYDADVEGNISVEFTEDVEEIEADKLEGTFTLEGEVEAEEEVEEDESKEKESVEEESEEKEKDQEVPEEETDSKDKNDANEEKKEASDDNKKEESSDEASSDKEVADKEKSAKEEPKAADKKKASKDDEKKDASDKKSSSKATKANDDGEKHGFNLELDEITDLEGAAFDEQHPMDPHQEFKLKLDWTLEDGHNYVEGDTETFDLPKGIKIQGNIEIPLTDDSGQVIANAVVTPDKKVELTFTDFVEGHSAVSGWMEIISTLDTEEVEEKDGEVIIDPIGEEGELRIPIEKSNKDKTIEKNGTPNKGYNADEINWQVIVNKNKTSLENAKVTDVLPEGTEYKDGSLVVTKLKVDLDGNILGDGEEVEIEPEFGGDGELIVPLGDTNDAYRVEYVTEVTDDEKKNFENNAKLTDDELNDVSAKSTVTINRGEAIKKSAATGYDPKTGIIEWEIEFNYNQKDLSDVTLEDAWTPEGALELVEDSLKFQEVTIDENGHAQNEGDAVDFPNDGANLNLVDDGFEVTGISTDKAYKVIYQTKVTDRVLDPINVSNTAGFGDESDGSGTHVGQYYGAKSAGEVDYAAKTIDWKIEINHDEYPMENISVEDTLGDGLTLLEDTIQITVDGQDYEGDYNLSGDNPFTIDFPEDFTTDKKIEIHYKTEFDADNVTDNIAKNKADITWTPEGEDEPITKEVEAEKGLNWETSEGSWKNGSYNPETKEITWTIYTNYRENDISNLIVKDEPQQNQQIVKDSAVVTELSIAANGGITEGDTVEGVATIDEDANTLEVNIGETNKAYKIEYKTSLEGLDDMKDEYTNQAEVFDGEESLSEIDARVGVVKDSKYGSKSGYQDGKQVHWSIDVNLVQQQIKDLTLVDTISDNQAYLEDSIKVYHATIDGNGNASKGEEVPSDEYDVTIEDTEFTVVWKDEVERAFIVEYSTLFFEKHGGNVRNDYVITGDSIEEDSDDSSAGHEITISQLGSGGGEGTAGYLVINKVDATHGKEETSLAGAEFDLIDADTGNVLKSGVTDENGQIDFGRLLFGDYQLKETKVPEGYVTPEEEQTITIDKAYKPGDDKEGFEYRVENYKPVFAVELSKTDEEGNALEGAEFTLFDAEDNAIETSTTDEDGKILFEDIEAAGTYYVQETKAPAGYMLDETKHEVTIGEKEQEPVEVSVENTPLGIVQLTKTDVDTNEALEGVEFELQKKNDSGDYEKVETEESFITNENGQIQTTEALDAGDYQFVEVKTLDGYRINEEPVKFEIKANEVTNIELTMTNEKFKGSVKLIKLDAATEELLKDAVFNLVDSEDEVVEEGLTTNDQGEIVVEDLLLGEYQLVETKAPEGYELDETPIDIEITEDEQVVEVDATNNQITDIFVEKKWNNSGGDTTPITVKLLPTDETVELNEENDWKAAFENQDVYDKDGNKINYDIEELNVDGYNSVVTGNSSDGFIVTNTETTSVSGEKIWKDDNLNERPDQITVKLLADGEQVDTEKVTVESDWKYTFKELDKYDEDGEEITYTIDEVEVSGYETNIDGFDIENVRVGTISVEGEKTWVDDDSEDRPNEITVELSREIDGEVDEDFSESQTVKPNDKGNWTYAFTDLDEFNNEGIAYTYTVKEANVPDEYKSEVNDHDITNTRTGKTEVSGTKKWKDDTAEDRPDEITINLLQNNVVVDTKEVTANDKWEYTFTELDKYDDAGKLYEYSVKEQDVEGYHSEVKGTDITNTRSETKDIEVNKAWLDDNAEERPETIEVYLKQNGDNFDTVELKAEDDWTYTFTNLEAFDENGKAYSYSVEEKAVKGYESTVDGFDITNLRVGETKVSGTKTWLDDDSEDRPEEITFKLLANGEETDETVTVDADSDWAYKFTELDKYDDQGVEIDYTVEEEAVDGYETTIDGFDITNLRVGKTEVTGEKTWKDIDEHYRPDSITIQLLANGDEIDSTEVTSDTGWIYAFTDLAKYDKDGKEIKYTVKEIDVPKGYESEVDGLDITNTQKETAVKGKKSWDEVDKQYRPDNVTIQLLANGEEASTVEISSEDNWKYAFTGLAKYDKDGKEINYTVKEVDVPKGYKSKVDGDNITNKQRTTEVTGTKTWLDGDGKDRPESITVELFANGDSIDTTKVTSKSDWKYEFTKLPKYDKEGEKIKYTIDEKSVEGYDKSIDGTDITNTKLTDVIGTKTWENDDSKNRPNSITVKLLQNGNEIDSTKVTAKSDWKYAFTDLPAYDKNGEAYKYTIEEVAVDGYKSKVDGYDITNTWIDEDEEDPTTKPTDPSDPSDETDKKDEKDETDKPGPTCEETIITIKKDGKPVDEGKTYKLTAKDGETSVTATTDASGKLTIDRDKLPSGTYVITDADGNKLGEVTITDDTCELEFDYTTSTGKPDEDKGSLLPSTATDTFNILLAGVLLLVVGAGFIIIRRNKNA